MKRKEDEIISDPFMDRLFEEIPEIKLPPEFTNKVMDRIYQEKQKQEKRTFIAIVCTSLSFIVLFSILIYTGVISLPVKEWLSTLSLSRSSFSLPVFFGSITLLLLFADYQIRKILDKKRNKMH